MRILSEVDAIVAGGFSEFVTPLMTRFFTTVTHLGDVETVAVFALMFAFYLWRKHRAYLLSFITIVGGSAASMWVLKELFARPRPIGALIMETGFAFPSGHATMAAAFFGFIIFTLMRVRSIQNWQRGIMILILAVWILLVGLSRVYLGVHHASDVMAGWLLGFIWILVVVRSCAKKSLSLAK